MQDDSVDSILTVGVIVGFGIGVFVGARVLVGVGVLSSGGVVGVLEGATVLVGIGVLVVVGAGVSGGEGGQLPTKSRLWLLCGLCPFSQACLATVIE